TTPDYAGLIERLRKPGTWARHGDDIIASDAKEELVRDDAPFEAATALRTLLERNKELERERDEARRQSDRFCDKYLAALSRAEAAEAKLAEAMKALRMMLKEHDILSGNFGD